MQTVIVLFFIVGCTLGAQQPSFPQGGLLVFPSPSNNSASTKTTTPPPVSNDKANLETFDASIMERLRQEVGSEQGVYHVYLPDGRLQRVQYTAAPVSQEVPAQQTQGSSGSANENQREGRGYTVVPQAVYFVQVPADRLQNLRTPEVPESQNTTEQNNQTAAQDSNSQVNSSAQYKDAAPSKQPQYLPITVMTVDQLSQFRSAQGSSQQTQANPPSQQEIPANQQQADPSNQESARQQQPGQDQAKGFVANVRYSEVQPINPPIYSYSPLVRILRYATD